MKEEFVKNNPPPKSVFVKVNNKYTKIRIHFITDLLILRSRYMHRKIINCIFLTQIWFGERSKFVLCV